MAGVKLLMLFALKSMKPVKANAKLVNGTHPVASWLRAHGKPVPDQEYQMSQVAMRELRECFDGLDEDSDGTISLHELRAALTQTEVRPQAPPLPSAPALSPRPSALALSPAPRTKVAVIALALPADPSSLLRAGIRGSGNHPRTVLAP